MSLEYNSSGFDRMEFERLIANQIQSSLILTPQADFNYPDKSLKPNCENLANTTTIGVNGESLKSPPKTDFTLHNHWPPRLIFPGAFNPVHKAHLEMAYFAQSKYRHSLWFEISVLNADKGALSHESTQHRTEQTFSPFGLVLTRAATFVEKSRVFPKSVFVVGADTICRVTQPKYYQNCEKRMKTAIETIAENECRFLVFARKMGNKLYTESNTHLVSSLAKLCEFVPANEFLLDYSSTRIRARSPDRGND